MKIIEQSATWPTMVTRGQGTEAVDRRQDARQTFTASVTAVDPGSGARIEARTSDISNGGCYVDAMTPFPEGSIVHIRLTKDGQSFSAAARVVYCKPGVGMGLEFRHPSGKPTGLLQTWLAELRGEVMQTHSLDEIETDGAGASVDHAMRERNAIEQMLMLLLRKGLISEEEGEPILRHLLQ